jgi:hypothetical protein
MAIGYLGPSACRIVPIRTSIIFATGKICPAITSAIGMVSHRAPHRWPGSVAHATIAGSVFLVERVAWYASCIEYRRPFKLRRERPTFIREKGE